MPIRPTAASYKELPTTDGTLYCSNRSARIDLGPLVNAWEWHSCLRDRHDWNVEPLPSVLAIILVHCEPSDPNLLFIENKKLLIREIRKRYRGKSTARFLSRNNDLAEYHILIEVQNKLATIGHFTRAQLELLEP